MDEERMARVLAYVDGELEPAEARAFEAEMARDPALARAAEAHAGLAADIAQAYAPVLEEPVPVGLAMAAAAANDRGRPGRMTWGAIAAALLVGALIERVTMPTGPLAPGGGALLVGAQIGRSLDTQLAADQGPIRVGLTFRDAAGRWCRTFQSAPDRLAGLACRQGTAWKIEVAAAYSPASGGAYRTAGSETPAAVLAAVDGLRAGESLSADAERAARDGGWR